MDYKEIKKKSGKKNFDKIKDGFESAGSKRQREDDDERFWKLAVNREERGGAIIRFLPSFNDDQLPWVETFSYFFQHPVTNKYYINKSRLTIGSDERDPAQELYFKLKDSKDPDDMALVKRLNNHRKYISNIVVLKDQANPDNEGKVFLYKYGRSIWDKCKKMSFPDMDFEERVDVFDLFEGANFKLVSNKGSNGWRNYNDSAFMTPGPVFKDEKEIERIVNECHDLSEFVDPKNFKSYEKLKEELYKVIHGDANNGGSNPNSLPDEAYPEDFTANENDGYRAAEQPQEEEFLPIHTETSGNSDKDNDDDFWQKLAEED